MLAALVFAADTAATLDLSDRSEVRYRATQQISQASNATPASPQQPTVTAGVDVSTQPALRLQVGNRQWNFTLQYGVNLLAPDVQLGIAPTVIHLANVSLAWHDRLYRVVVGEDASYGQQNSGFLLPAQTPAGAPPSLQPGAAPTTIQYGSTRSYLTVDRTLSRRLSAGVSAELLAFGGLDDPSRQTLPVQVTERATVGLTYQATEVDTFIGAVSAQQSTFGSTACYVPPGQPVPPSPAPQCAPVDTLEQGRLQLTHRFSRTTTGSAAGGVVLAQTRVSTNAPTQDAVFALAEVSLTQVLGDRGKSSLTALARLAPYLDFRTGLVTDAAFGQLTLLEQLTRTLALRLSAATSQSLASSTAPKASVFQGELATDLVLAPTVTLTVGERGLWQTQETYGAFVSDFTFCAVTLKERPLHL